MSQHAARFTGSIPENYDLYLGPRIFVGFAEDLARRVLELQPDKVLELAAGTGILTRRLRDVLPAACTITATDLNPPMLEISRGKFQGNEGVEFKAADAMHLPFIESDFDVATSQFGVMFFPDKQRSYEEVFRTLRAGGHYIFNVWGPMDSNPFAKIAHETVASFYPEDPPGFYKVPFGYNDPVSIENSLNEAGFSGIEIEKVEISSSIPSASDFARGLVYGNPLHEEIILRGGQPDSLCSAIAAALEQHLGEVMPLQAFVIVARKP
ncbi:class I SAM-dependent methyltransferase [Seongchinamella unica]|uniref:class I SAM-dependent methyltransferase n=1 Tax=Seongchinamella unica TaxID=2547392 RepID=UPI001404C9A5|nr:class I SAM-dependent methyltransferase [Seongchinamella unica]